MMKKRILAILLVVGIVLLVVVGLGQIPASRGYCVEASFSDAPADDGAFEKWLMAQPGVVEHTFQVYRTSTSSPKLVLVFIMVQNCWLKPPFPEVETAAHDLGYTLDPPGFVDQQEPD